MNKKVMACILFAGALLYGSCNKNTAASSNSPNVTSVKQTNWVAGNTIVNGTYELVNVGSGASNYAINYALNGTNPPLLVENTYSDLNNNQRFTITSLGSGYFKIINVTTGKAVSAFNTLTGWQLELDPYTGDTKQQWQIVYVAAGSGTNAGYKIVCKANTALVATASTTASNSPIVNATALTTNANSQRWTLSMVAYQDDIVTNFFKRTTGSEAFDGNFSIPLSNGKVVWFTNDVFYNQLSGGMLPCLFNNHNSVMEQPTATNWIASATTNYVASGDPNVSDGSPNLFWDLNLSRYIWPGAGIQIGNFVYAYCNEIQNSGNSFIVTNGLLANLNLTNHQVNYQALPALNGINFGIGMIQSGTKVYVYGYKNASLGADVYVAQFDTSAPATWTFWNGSSFVSASTSAVSIGTAASAGAYVAQINGKYVMISTAFNDNVTCDAVTNIFSSFTTSPTGPFSSLKVIYSIPDRKSGYTPYFYAPIIHPQATVSGSNEFLFTYCINFYAPCLTSCVSNQEDPDSYRPRGVRVPYSVVDPSL